MFNFNKSNDDELALLIAEIGKYQYKYDNMKDIDDINERIENRKALLSEEYIPENEKELYQNEINILKWVLNKSVRKEQSRDTVTDSIKNFNEQYKQLSIYDIEGDNNDKTCN